MADGRTFNINNVTFMSCYFLAKKAHHNKKPVQFLWDTILQQWFPTTGPRCFKLAFKSPSPASGDRLVRIVIEVQSLAPGAITNSAQLLENQVFMVACESSEKDTPNGWEDARVQLIHCLEENVNGSVALFGAVAIGTKVEVYECELQGDRPSLRLLHHDQLDLGSGGDRLALEVAMEHARTECWNFALRR